MVTLVFLIVGTLFFVFLAGGSLERLARVEVKGLWLAWVAVLARSLPTVMHVRRESNVNWIAWGLAFLVVVIVGLMNCRMIRGSILLSLGAAANLAAIAANKGMPVVPWATKGALDALHVVLASPRLPVITDVLAVRTDSVFSVGDVLMFVGFFVAVLTSSIASKWPHTSGL